MKTNLLKKAYKNSQLSDTLIFFFRKIFIMKHIYYHKLTKLDKINFVFLQFEFVI